MKINQFLEDLEHSSLSQTTQLANYIDSEVLFQSLVNNELQRQVGDDLYKQAIYVISQYFKSVQLCRNNELDSAYKQLEFSDSLFLDLPMPISDYVTVYKQSTWSNYSYKIGDLHKAIEQIRYGLSVSAKLEKCGYDAFMYRRIGQIYNVNTIYYKQGKFDIAHKLLKNTLVFLYSGKAEDMMIDDWNIANIQKTRVLQEGALDGVFNTLAIQNISQMKNDVYNDEYHYNYYFKYFLENLDANSYNRVIIYNWMYTKSSYFEDGLEVFLDNAFEFLTDSDTIPEYDILKANILAQIIFFMQSEHSNKNSYFDLIKRFAQNNLKPRAYTIIEKF